MPIGLGRRAHKRHAPLIAARDVLRITFPGHDDPGIVVDELAAWSAVQRPGAHEAGLRRRLEHDLVLERDAVDGVEDLLHLEGDVAALPLVAHGAAVYQHPRAVAQRPHRAFQREPQLRDEVTERPAVLHHRRVLMA